MISDLGYRLVPTLYKNRLYHWFQEKRSWPKLLTHSVQFTSIGGVGTTFLYDFSVKVGLDVYQAAQGGRWAAGYGIWKHMRCPLNSLTGPQYEMPPNYRVIYLIGNPRLAVISIFRRNYQLYALDRLQVPFDVKKKFSKNWGLEEYANNGQDLFLLDEHVMNWVERPLPKSYSILVLKYEEIKNNKSVLFDFLELSRRQRSEFPTLAERKSNLTEVSTNTASGLAKIYRGLEEKIAELPPSFIR